MKQSASIQVRQIKSSDTPGLKNDLKNSTGNIPEATTPKVRVTTLRLRRKNGREPPDYWKNPAAASPPALRQLQTLGHAEGKKHHKTRSLRHRGPVFVTCNFNTDAIISEPEKKIEKNYHRAQ